MSSTADLLASLDLAASIDPDVLRSVFFEDDVEINVGRLNGETNQSFGRFGFDSASNEVRIDAFEDLAGVPPNLVFRVGDITAPVEVMRVHDTAEVSIGTTAVLGRFAVAGDTVGQVTVLIRPVAAQTANIFEVEDSGGATNHLFVTDNGNVMMRDVEVLNVKCAILPPVTVGTNVSALNVAAAAHTGLPSGQIPVAAFDFGVTQTFTGGGGAIALVNPMSVTAPTYAAAAAQTITRAVTLRISAAPAVGANITITNPFAMTIDGGDVGIAANVGIGNAFTSPSARLTVTGGNIDVTSGGANPETRITQGSMLFGAGGGTALDQRILRTAATLMTFDDGSGTGSLQLVPHANFNGRIGTALLMWGTICAGQVDLRLAAGDAQPSLFLDNTPRIRFGAGGATVFDVEINRGAANRLDLVSGDSLAIVSGSLFVSATAAVGAEIFRVTAGTSLIDFTSTTALQVTQTGGGTPAIVVDTTNTRVGIGAAPGAFTLDVTGTANISGKLTVGGAIDPPSVALSGGTALFYESDDGVTAPVSGAATGRLRYDNTGSGNWQISVQGGAYANLVTGTGPESPWTKTGAVIHPDTLTDEVSIGSASSFAKLTVVGDATGQITTVIRAVAAQTARLVEVQDSAGTDFFALGRIDGIGVWCDITGIPTTGSAGNTVLALRTPVVLTATAGINHNDAFMDFGRTFQYTTGAAVPLFVGFNFIGQTSITATGATQTVDVAAAVMISNAPSPGLNVAITNSYALFVDGGNVRIDEDLIVGAVAQVGTEKLRVTGGTSLLDFTSTTALQVTQTGGGTPALTVDTTNTTVGINSPTPARKLEIIDSGAPQIRLTETDGVNFADLRAQSDGSLLFGPSGTVTLFSKSSAGNTISLQSANTDNSSVTSHAEIKLIVGGSAGGDPYVHFLVNGVATSEWSFGPDNSNSDMITLSQSSTVGGGNNHFFVTTGGNVGIGAAPGAFTLDVTGTVNISGKLTVGGAIDPPSVALSGGTALFYESNDGVTAPVSGAATGRIRYNDSTGTWQSSTQTGAYVDFATGAAGGSLDDAYDFGGAGAGRIIEVTGGTLPVQFRLDTGAVPALDARTTFVLSNTSAVGDDVGMSLITGTSGECDITFGDTAAEFRGRIRYRNVLDDMEFFAGGVEVLTVGNTLLTINQDNGDIDTTIEGQSLTFMFHCDASSATENIAFLTTSQPNWQTMDRGVFVGDVTTEPTGNPANGFFHYSNAGGPKWRGSDGGIVTFDSFGRVGVNQTPTVDIPHFITHSTTATGKLRGMFIDITATAAVGFNGNIFEVTGTITEAASGVHGQLGGALFTSPTITGGVATTTDGFNVKMEGTPSIGVQNRVLWLTDATASAPHLDMETTSDDAWIRFSKIGASPRSFAFGIDNTDALLKIAASSADTTLADTAIITMTSTGLVTVASGDLTVTSGFVRAGGTGGTADAFLEMDDGATVAVGAAGEVRMRSNAGTFEISENGGAFAAPGGGGTLDDAYDFGGAGAGRTITADAGAVHINIDGGSIPATAASVGLIVSNTSAAADNAEISLISGASGIVVLNLGDTADEDRARVTFTNGTDLLQFIVGGDTNPQVNINSAGVIFNEGGQSTYDLRIESNNSTDMFFLDSGNDRIQMQKDNGSLPARSNDSVLIIANTSVTGDNAGLSIISGATGNTILNFGDTADENAGFIDYDHNDDSMDLATATVVAISISSGQVVQIPNLGASLDVQTDGSSNLITVSDERAKNIYGPARYGLPEIMKLEPVLFNYKTDPIGSRRNIGFTAQNVMSVIPEAVGIANGDYLGLNSRGIIAALVNAVQEQQKQIEDLKTKLAA